MHIEPRSVIRGKVTHPDIQSGFTLTDQWIEAGLRDARVGHRQGFSGQHLPYERDQSIA